MSKPFKKFDGGKRRWRLLPFEIINDVVSVFDFGADKYGVDNWKECDDWDRYFDAMMRHIIAWRLGERVDKETNIHHLAHAMCCAIFLMWRDKNERS
jgi:hypothetical protein|tara:strand:+ start:138 stop:428 length:291 start_codon:yes stop_codon:yes gene_type:complete